MHDLVIRGGTIVDGSGGVPFTGDVAVADGVIVAVGPVAERGRREIDADGAIVTPGFVDAHTHYDGQVMWDPMLTPSSWHGVTTAIVGNCGVGFAPARPEDQEWVSGLMQGVEDIPGDVISAGLEWQWESFPEYMDAIARRRLAVDVVTQIPHGVVRRYVMGERAAANEEPTDDELERMALLVRDAIKAGAAGFSTSRTLTHRGADGTLVPGTFASTRELLGITQHLRALAAGTVQVVMAGSVGEDLDAPVTELEWMTQVGKATGRPVVYALIQNNRAPDAWRQALELTERANGAGAQLRAQSAVRPIGSLVGLATLGDPVSSLSYINPLRYRPSFDEVSGLPHSDMVSALRDPARRQRILSEDCRYSLPEMAATIGPASFDKIFVMGAVPNYEPGASDSVLALAASQGREPEDLFYDLLLQDDGNELMFCPMLNFHGGTLDAIYEILSHDYGTVGLGDGGAHMQSLCDASYSTFLLSHWVRDRRGKRLSLQKAIQKLTSEPADLWGLRDRGRIAEGLKADVNIIDAQKLDVLRPEKVSDMPSGASRLVQRARGYLATINRGVVVVENDELTGACPGSLAR